MPTITCTVNGTKRTLEVAPGMSLLTMLRDGLGLTGTKEGCSEGDCGACTVLVDGKALDSCIYPAMEVAGRRVLTVEGMADGARLHPLQQAFIDHGAVQCGFCIPGMLLSARALLDAKPKPTEDEVRMAIAGNLCRCTGYTKIVEAILAASQRG